MARTLLKSFQKAQHVQVVSERVYLRVDWKKEEAHFRAEVAGKLTRASRRFYLALYEGYALESVEGKEVAGARVRTFPGAPGYLIEVKLKRKFPAGSQLTLFLKYRTKQPRASLYQVGKREAFFQWFFFPIGTPAPFDLTVVFPSSLSAMSYPEVETVHQGKERGLRARQVTALELALGREPMKEEEWTFDSFSFRFWGREKSLSEFARLASFLALVFREYTDRFDTPPPCQPLTVYLPQELSLRPHLTHSFLVLSAKRPSRARELLALLSHEIGHCYFGLGEQSFLSFQGSPWLVEGMAEFLSLKLDAARAKKAPVGRLSFPQIARAQIRALQNRAVASSILEEALYGGDEEAMYSKGALVLRFFFSQLTPREEKQVLRRAFEATQKGLTSSALQTIFEEVTGRSWHFAFQHFVFGHTLLDLTPRRENGALSMATGVPEPLPFSIPVRFTLRDGKEVFLSFPEEGGEWSSQGVLQKIPLPHDLLCVEVDPDALFPDSRRSNNTLCW